jgi:hypothetical protein
LLAHFVGPSGIQLAAWDEVYDATVLHFQNDARLHRERLFNNAREICDLIRSQGSELTVLIDGSFVTSKELPNDIDVWVFAEITDGLISKNLLDSNWLNWLHDSSSRVQNVDVYVYPSRDGMIVDKSAAKEYGSVSVTWFVEQLGIWFASGRDEEPPKGAFLIKS